MEKTMLYNQIPTIWWKKIVKIGPIVFEIIRLKENLGKAK